MAQSCLRPHSCCQSSLNIDTLPTQSSWGHATGMRCNLLLLSLWCFCHAGYDQRSTAGVTSAMLTQSHCLMRILMKHMATQTPPHGPDGHACITLRRDRNASSSVAWRLLVCLYVCQSIGTQTGHAALLSEANDGHAALKLQDTIPDMRLPP